MEDRRRAGLWLGLAGLNGAVAVAAGAIGAHGAGPDGRALVVTASSYHLVHAAALFGVGILMRARGGRLVEWAGWAFLAGCILFSGGLYANAAGLRALGVGAPVGGMSFILGWLLLAAGGLRDWRRFRDEA